MTMNVEEWYYGDPQFESQSPVFDEQWFYGDPQHEAAAPLNVELRESRAYLQSWARYAKQQGHRDLDAKRPILTPPSVASPR
ncbi:hypothetical protein [Haladaptatus halobius]|uniref:hypothetical protein n=1 Tax=Haladaptatus halobius TaxID=2884875 RepID=UPI001D0AE91F|nr:hypothetical protein [Haladaptatus halobius]